MDTQIPDANLGIVTHDIGAFDSAMLICGGAYSNLEALSALLDAAEEHGIDRNHIVHTGDAVAYCADPAETAQLLRDSGAHAIQGNVEESLAASLPDCGCGFDEGSACDKLAAEWFSFADVRVGEDLRRWMAGLPHQLIFEMAGRRVRVVHGAVSSINRFMFESLDVSDFEAEMALGGADMVVAGHSGIPFTRRMGERTWHNSGPLGLPANDGTPRGWYSILTPQEHGGIAIRHLPLAYNHQRAHEKMLNAGVCQDYARTLVSGIWPSMDVLPERERGTAGVPLKFDAEILREAAGVPV